MSNSKTNQYKMSTFSKCGNGKLKVHLDIFVNTRCFNIKTQSHTVK